MTTSKLARHVIAYGVIGGLAIAALRAIEYRWIVVEHSIEIYGALVAAVFAIVGVWVGLKFTARREKVVVREVPVRVEVPVAALFEVDEAKLAELRKSRQRQRKPRIWPRATRIRW